MAKILQIIDVDSDGHKVRLDDGRIVRMSHGAEHPHIGQDYIEPTLNQTNSDDGPEPEPEDERVFYGPYPCGACGVMICQASREHGAEAFDYPEGPIYPNTPWRVHNCTPSQATAQTGEQLNSDAQVKAQDLLRTFGGVNFTGGELGRE